MFWYSKVPYPFFFFFLRGSELPFADLWKVGSRLDLEIGSGLLDRIPRFKHWLGYVDYLVWVDRRFDVSYPFSL